LKDKGSYYENIALRWLKAKGLKLVAKNYHSRSGEIDLIMLDQKTLCFIEVKYRASQAFGGAAYSITLSKQKKITQTALSFINQQNRYRNHAKRFDALLIEPGLNDTEDMQWIKNAFDASYD
jgi:putative endonuclease